MEARVTLGHSAINFFVSCVENSATKTGHTKILQTCFKNMREKKTPLVTANSQGMRS